MKRILAIFAFAVFAVFLLILVIGVPRPDLITIVLITAALVAWDFITSSGRRGNGNGSG